MKRKNCIICNEDSPLTREHRIKSSLLEFFNSFENDDPEKELKFNDGSEAGCFFKNIKKAKNLKPYKNICATCNSARSTDCDIYFDKFIKDQYTWQFGVKEIESLESPSNDDVFDKVKNLESNLIKPVEGTLWMDSVLFVNSKYLITSKYQIYSHGYNDALLKKYLAKHTICYLDRSKIPYDPNLRSIFLNGKNLELLKYTLYFLPRDFQHGYLNSVVRFPNDKIEYALIFSNIAIHVETLNPKK